jgi:hypothetical protein
VNLEIVRVTHVQQLLLRKAHLQSKARRTKLLHVRNLQATYLFRSVYTRGVLYSAVNKNEQSNAFPYSYAGLRFLFPYQYHYTDARYPFVHLSQTLCNCRSSRHASPPPPTIYSVQLSTEHISSLDPTYKAVFVRRTPSKMSLTVRKGPLSKLLELCGYLSFKKK